MRAHEQLELLSAYVDGELDDATIRSIEAHLPGCADCRVTLDALRATMADLALLEEPELDPSISWSLRAQIARARKRPGRFTRAAMALSGVAAVAIAFVAFSTMGGRQATTGPQDSAARVTSEGDSSVTALAEAPNVFVDSGNYTKKSALTLLDPELSSFGGAAAPSDSQVDWIEVYTRCEPTVTKDAEVSYVLQTAIGSRFEDDPALLLVYDVGEGENARRELWVLDPGSCRVRYFAQD